MKINKTIMAVIAAAGVLTVCPAVHAQDATNTPPAQTTPRARRGGPTLESIDKAVTLTDEQKPKVKLALEDLNKTAQDAANLDQDERRTKMRSAREDFNKKMKDILTPDQYTKFEAMPRGGRRGGAGGGGGGGNGGGGQ
jgi:Spy/CpxP family protein refolding chaperone